MATIRNAQGLIIDFRCYSNDFIVFSLGRYLFPGPTPFVTFTQTNLHSPGVFTFDTPFSVGAVNEDYFKGQIVILINEETQSSAEYHVMAFRKAPRATVIGSTTAGADGNISAIPLPGNITTWISGLGVYYTDGGETQRVGIIPDIPCRPTLHGIRAGRDECLEVAIRHIRESTH